MVNTVHRDLSCFLEPAIADVESGISMANQRWRPSLIVVCGLRGMGVTSVLRSVNSPQHLTILTARSGYSIFPDLARALIPESLLGNNNWRSDTLRALRTANENGRLIAIDQAHLIAGSELAEITKTVGSASGRGVSLILGGLPSLAYRSVRLNPERVHITAITSPPPGLVDQVIIDAGYHPQELSSVCKSVAMLATALTARDVGATAEQAINATLLEHYWAPINALKPAELKYLQTAAQSPMAPELRTKSSSRIRDSLVKMGLIYGSNQGSVRVAIPGLAAWLTSNESATIAEE